MSQTVKFCPICGASVKVEYWRGSEVKEGFWVQCQCGSISFVEWPDEDHEDDCTCQKCEDHQEALQDIIDKGKYKNDN